MSRKMTCSEEEMLKLMRGWRWSYKGQPVGRWAEQNKIVWKEEKPCAS